MAAHRPCFLCILQHLLLLCLIFPATTEHDPAHRKAAEVTLVKAFDKINHEYSKDVFETLSESEQHLWSYNNGQHVNATIESLVRNAVHIYVDVKLVGFGADGNQQLYVMEAELQRFLHIVSEDLESIALDSGLPLVVKPHVIFRVWKGQSHLLKSIETAIAPAVKAQVGDSSPLRMVNIPHTIVDSIIKADYQQEQHGAFTVYLLNPRQPVAPYLYAYGEGSCPGQLWVGNLPYVWVDITAGPSRYGPGPGGKGIVMPSSIPRIGHYKKAHLAQAIVADLASFVLTLSKHLFWPPLHHTTPKRAKEVYVHIIYLHEELIGGRSIIAPSYVEEILQGFTKEMQVVSVKEHFLSYASCEFCTAALGRALQTQSQRARGRSISMQRLDYLDSHELHHWLTLYADYIMSHAGIHINTEDGLPTTLPVFIFDLTTNAELLLDGEHRALAFDNMAVAVVTRAPAGVSRLVCNSVAVMTEPARTGMSLIAAMAQAGWAVADPAAYWHPATGFSTNYLLHVGNTPFGVLSRSTGQPFVMAHAAGRNLVITEFNNSVTHAVTLLQGFAELAGDSGHVDKKMIKPQLALYRKRVNLLLFKATEAMNWLGRNNYARAFLVARSMRHDVDALHHLARRVNKDHHLALVCPKHPLAWTIWLLPAGCVFGVALAVYVALSTQEDKLRDW